MNSKGLLILTVIFASMLIVGSVGAVSTIGIPIPIQITLIPTSNFIVNDISFVYTNISSLRYNSVNINITNISSKKLTCQTNIDFYQSATKIAGSGWKLFNFTASQTKIVTVDLTWDTSKNLTDMTSGTITIISII